MAAPHDVRITRETKDLPPEDGWACLELTGYASLECTCGHKDGPMVNRLAPLMAHMHIAGHA